MRWRATEDEVVQVTEPSTGISFPDGSLSVPRTLEARLGRLPRVISYRSPCSEQSSTR
jgi:hypothetical protein